MYSHTRPPPFLGKITYWLLPTYCNNTSFLSICW